MDAGTDDAITNAWSSGDAMDSAAGLSTLYRAILARIDSTMDPKVRGRWQAAQAFCGAALKLRATLDAGVLDPARRESIERRLDLLARHLGEAINEGAPVGPCVAGAMP